MSSSLEKNDDGNEEEFHELTTTTTEQHEKEGRRQQKHHPLYHGTNLAPKALIFDCDGTILETMTLFFVADKQTCEEYGLELTKKRFYELAGVPIKEIFRLLRDEQGKTEEEITEEDLDRMTLRCGELAEEMGAPEIIQSTETIIMHGKRNGGTDGGGVERVPRSRSNAFEAERPVRFIRLRGDVRRRGAWETGAGFVFISREEVTRRSERVHRVRGCVIRHREREESRNGCSRRETVRRVPESRGVVL